MVSRNNFIIKNSRKIKTENFQVKKYGRKDKTIAERRVLWIQKIKGTQEIQSIYLSQQQPTVLRN